MVQQYLLERGAEDVEQIYRSCPNLKGKVAPKHSGLICGSCTSHAPRRRSHARGSEAGPTSFDTSTLNTLDFLVFGIADDTLPSRNQVLVTELGFDQLPSVHGDSL
jgi:hypothetical protein